SAEKDARDRANRASPQQPHRPPPELARLPRGLPDAEPPIVRLGEPRVDEHQKRDRLTGVLELTSHLDRDRRPEAKALEDIRSGRLKRLDSVDVEAPHLLDALE